MVKPLPLKLDDEKAERVRRSHEAALLELQARPASGERIVTVSLADGKATPVAHGLGRAPIMVTPSIVRGAASAGYIVETRDGDRTKAVTLTANGYGATVTLEVSFQ